MASSRGLALFSTRTTATTARPCSSGNGNRFQTSGLRGFSRPGDYFLDIGFNCSFEQVFRHMFQSFHPFGITLQRNNFKRLIQLYKSDFNLHTQQLSANDRESYGQLALEIFSKYAPKDGRFGQSECPHCSHAIPDW